MQADAPPINTAPPAASQQPAAAASAQPAEAAPKTDAATGQGPSGEAHALPTVGKARLGRPRKDAALDK